MKKFEFGEEFITAQIEILRDSGPEDIESGIRFLMSSKNLSARVKKYHRRSWLRCPG